MAFSTALLISSCALIMPPKDRWSRRFRRLQTRLVSMLTNALVLPGEGGLAGQLIIRLLTIRRGVVWSR